MARARGYTSMVGILLMLGPLAATAAAQEHPEPLQPLTATSPEAAARAREHFQRAKDLYQSGAYREAISELEAARAIDPNAKDLVFNLGVVNEKLGHIEDALIYFKQYATMDLTPDERTRAEAYLKRLQGAKAEVVVPVVVTAPTPPPRPVPTQPPEPPKGRFDAATFLAAGCAVVGFGVGVAFGAKALADKPPPNFVTGPDGTYDQLANATTTAHREAVVADIGLGVGVAATLVTAYLYLARPRTTTNARPGMTGSATPAVAVSGVSVPGGGALLLRGSF